MSPERAHGGAAVTAAGVVSPFGRGTGLLWSGLLAGRCCFAPVDGLLRQRLALAAAVPESDLDAAVVAEDRAVALCVAAYEELSARPAFATVDRRRLGVCIGSTQGAIARWERHQRLLDTDDKHRPPAPHGNHPLLEIVRRSGAGGPRANPSLACASGTAALGIGLEWLRCGHCDAAIVGGVDALSRFVYEGFTALRALDAGAPRPFDADRAGLGLGEGAALLLVQRDPAEAAVEVAGWGSAWDANHLTGPDPTGSGVARAVVAALRDAGVEPAEVDFVNAHGTGTVYNDLMESKGFARVFGDRLADLPVNSVKGAIGHSLAAAGAVEAVVCQQVVEHGLIPATVGLSRRDPRIPLDLVAREARPAACRTVVSSSSGFGGINVAVVLRHR